MFDIINESFKLAYALKNKLYHFSKHVSNNTLVADLCNPIYNKSFFNYSKNTLAHNTSLYV